MRRLLLVLSALLVWSAPSLHGRFAIALVNSSQSFTQSPGGTTVNADTASVTTGNLSVLAVCYTTSTTSTVSGIAAASNTYTLAIVDNNPGSDDYRCSIWYKEDATGDGSNQPVVTFSNSGASYVTVVTLQYSGIATSSALDQTAICDAQNTADIVTGAFTTTQADEVVVSAAWIFHDTSAGWTAPASYTNQIETTNKMGVMFDRIVSGIQTGEALTATNAQTATMVHVAATFKMAGGAPAFPGAIINTPIRGGGRAR